MTTSNGDLILALVPEASWGPAMKALPTEKMRKFVLAVSAQSKRHWSQAAIEAGYRNDSPASLAVTASRLAHDERVVKALEEIADLKLRHVSPQAVETIVREMETAQESKDRLKAAGMLLDRSGFGPTSTQKIEVRRSNELIVDTALLETIQRMAQEIGVTPRPAPAIARPADATKVDAEDAQFEEVWTRDDWTA